MASGLAWAFALRYRHFMCGRFALTLPIDAVAQWFDVVHVNAQFDEPRYNICPSQQINVVVNYQQERRLTPMRWGFIPHWYKSPSDGPMIINARGETVSEKPAFREAVKTRRCLIPASGFYEWHREKGKGKEPWFLPAVDQDLMGFAGIWQAWTSPEGMRHVTCAMITSEAGPDIANIHHREPVVISQSDAGRWLGEGGDAFDLIHAAPQGYYAPYRVKNDVNSARYDAAELLEPLKVE